MQKQAIFISGASSGIGKACAYRLADAGYHVIAGIRKMSDANALEQERNRGIEAVFVDITDQGSIRSLVKRVNFLNLIGLVNNAGTAVLGPLEFIPIEKIREQFEVNFFGHLSLTQALLPFLRQSSKISRIVNISSISGFTAFPFFGAYAASKFALEAFNDSLRRELKTCGIKVISIQPGNVSTPIWGKSYMLANSMAEGFPPEALILYEKSIISSGRDTSTMINPETVAEKVLHAFTAKRPKTHYLVGRDAIKYYVLKRILPSSWLDRVL